MFHFLDEVHGVVGDQVWQIVTLIVISMMLQDSIVVEGVVVVATVPDQSHPV